jgi:5'-oxoaverantin cyclase/versicolorin B synthase
MRRSLLFTTLLGIPGIGLAWGSSQQQQSLVSTVFNSIPGVASFFGTSNDDATQAAQMDGRIQGKDLLSSHFGPYGWPGQSFDYVIVGGGTAGLAVAKRLAENGSCSVAVIEAGGFYEIEAGNATEVPMYLFNYFFDNGKVKNPLFDWYQYTVPQPVRIHWEMDTLVSCTNDVEGPRETGHVLHAGQDSRWQHGAWCHALPSVGRLAIS